MKILVVDDNPDILENIADELRYYQHQVVSAENGQQAYEYFSAAAPSYDLVLTDAKMPVMDGLELLKKIRLSGSNIPVVLITGHADVDMTIAALKMGAIDFIKKPFTLNDLSQLLTKVEQMLHPQQELKEILPFADTLQAQLRIPSRFHLIEPAAAYLRNLYKPVCEAYGLDVDRVFVAVREAISNAVYYGNLEIDVAMRNRWTEDFRTLVQEREALPEYGNRLVTIRYALTSRSMTFEVEDQGQGLDPKYLPGALNVSNLLFGVSGLVLIYTFMDEVTWNSERNCIKMVLFLESKTTL